MAFEFSPNVDYYVVLSIIGNANGKCPFDIMPLLVLLFAPALRLSV